MTKEKKFKIILGIIGIFLLLPAVIYMIKENTEGKSQKEEPLKVEVFFLEPWKDGYKFTSIEREIPANSDKKFEALVEKLVEGPTEKDRKETKIKDLMTLIPNGTKLIKLEKEGNTANLYFNENIKYYEEIEREWLKEQIGKTITQSPDIKNVRVWAKGEPCKDLCYEKKE